MKNMFNVILLMLMVSLSGCSIIRLPVEVMKKAWGSSIEVLENARNNAITKTYDKSYWDVVKASVEACDKNGYVVFKKDEINGYMVIMGIKGAVNTTEVGIFFVELNDHQTRVEIASLSTNTKRIVAKNLFHNLDIIFGYVPPDLEEIPTEDPSEQDGS